MARAIRTRHKPWTAVSMRAKDIRGSRALVHVAAGCTVVSASLVLMLAAAEHGAARINEAMAAFDQLPAPDEGHLMVILRVMVAAGLVGLAGAGAIWFGDARVVKTGRLVLVLFNATVWMAVVMAWGVDRTVGGMTLAVASGVAALAAAVSDPVERSGW